MRVHQAGEDQNALIVLHAGGANAVARGQDRNAAQAVEIGRHAPLQIELIVKLVGGRLIRNAVAEIQRADRGLDLVGRGERGRDRRIGFGLDRTHGAKAAQAGEQQRHQASRPLHSMPSCFSPFAFDAAEAEMAGRGVDRLGVARGGAIAAAIARRAEKRAAFDHLARNLDIGLARIVALRLGPPRGFCGMQQGLAGSALCFCEYQSVVHSHTLPIMS